LRALRIVLGGAEGRSLVAGLGRTGLTQLVLGALLMIGLLV
jgi:hypothetical protein